MAMVGALFSSIVAALVISVKGIDAALAGFALSFSLDFSGAVMCEKILSSINVLHEQLTLPRVYTTLHKP